MASVDDSSTMGLGVLQLVVAALVLGVVIFAVVAMVVAPVGATTGSLDVLRMVAYGVLVGGSALALVLRHVLLPPPRRDDRNPFGEPQPADDDGGDPAAIQRFGVATIVGSAVLEGVALLGVLLYMFSGRPMDLVVAGLPLLLIAGAFFPTEGRYRRFVG